MSAPTSTYPAAPPTARRLLRTAALIAGACVLGQAVFIVDASPAALLSGLSGMAELVSEGLPPDPAALGPALQAMLETIDIAVVATVASVVLSIPLAACAARNLAAGRILYAPTRAIAAFFRAIPSLVWALMFVVAVGLGPFAGVLALTVHSTGMLVRLYAESIEEMPIGPVEALVTSGANRAQVFTHAVVPELLPNLAGLALYRLEENVRSSLVLGFVGAGGIGFQILSAMEMFVYPQVTTLVLALFALVIAVELGSAALRRYLR
ncbi:MAG: phosphonate ABC transporter, permease protein PhnE [Pseudonocardiaceae bacterium]